MSTPPAAISEPMMTKKDFTSMEKEVVEKMDKVTTTIKNLEEELTKIRAENMNSIHDISNKSSENLEKVKRQLDNSESLLAKYENKLAEYNNRVPEIPIPNYKEQDEWKENFLRALDAQKTQVSTIATDLRLIQNQLTKLPQKSDTDLVQNLTLGKLEEIKEQIPRSSLGPLENLESTLNQVRAEAAKNHDVVKSSFNELTEISSHLTESFSSNYENIR